MKKHSILASLTMLTAAAFLHACGDDNPNVPPPAGQPGTTPQWSSLSLRSECTPPDNAPLCTQGTLQVQRDGRYTFQGRGNNNSTGNLTSSELTAVSLSADAVGTQDLSGAAACQQ